MVRSWLVVGAVAGVLLAGCGSGEDRPGQVTSETPGNSRTGSVSNSGAVGDAPSAASDGYKPVSAVDSHAAIGKDAAEIRTLMEPAAQGGDVDWERVRTVFREGSNSRKTDGSLRSLATLTGDTQLVEFVDDAIAGRGSSADAPPAVRRQRVDKGITVLLERKVMSELEAAVTKAERGEADPASGAPHNVDEAWAFYVAGEQGPASAALKRGADFGLGRQVHEQVVGALARAQAEALRPDAAALREASAQVESALDRIFYLATFKYLDTKGSPATRAEGEAFYRAIQPEVRSASAEADRAITAAFESGDSAAGRAALNSPPVLAVLGIAEADRVERMPG